MSKTGNNGKENNFKGAKGKQFTSEYQPTPEAKKKGHQEKKALEQVKQEIIEKSFAKINALLEKEELTSQELRDIFKTAVDMSGYKKQTQEMDLGGIQVSINRKAVDVEN